MFLQKKTKSSRQTRLSMQAMLATAVVRRQHHSTLHQACSVHCGYITLEGQFAAVGCLQCRKQRAA